MCENWAYLHKYTCSEDNTFNQVLLALANFNFFVFITAKIYHFSLKFLLIDYL